MEVHMLWSLLSGQKVSTNPVIVRKEMKGSSMGLPATNAIDHTLTAMDVLDPLVKASIITKQEAERYLQLWGNSKKNPLSLVETLSVPDRRMHGKIIAKDILLSVIANGFGIQYQRIDLLKLSLDVVGSILPYAYIDRLNIVPIHIDEEKVIFLTAEPFVLSWVDEVKRQVKKKIVIQLSTPAQIKHIINEIYVVQKAFKSVSKEQGQAGAEKLRLLKQGKVRELDELIDKSKNNKIGGEGNVAKIVDWMINFALMERASDIHLEPKRGLGHIRFRIDGDLRTVYRLEPEALLMVISRFKILADMKLDEKRKPLDGGLKRTLDNGKQVEMRLSTVPTPYGEKLVIRIFDKQVASKDLSFIGFTETDLKIWDDLIHQPHGLILVTGPTGSGKTTTLYTTLNKVATPEVNVCTAEDPIEMEVDTFNQVQVNTSIGLTFAECIRAFLRQDPDIIMVGEIRDFETGEMAIQSSLTGHLVFSTLHTNGALATIQRLIDLGLPTFLINSSLSGILAQRLVKKLCSHCKTQVPADKNKWETLLDGEKVPMPEFYYAPVGCDECKNTGYSGRICVYELVKLDERFKKIIHSNVEFSELREKTRGLFTSIRGNGARKIIEGETSIDEVLMVIY